MVFNPNLDAGPAPESPVYTNVGSTGGGMATVAGNALEALGGLVVRGAERREARQARELRQSFVSGLQGIRARVDAGDINGASIAAGNLMASYASAGGELDTEARTLATTITGLPERLWGVSQNVLNAEAQRAARAEMLSDPTFQAYLTLERQANPNLSQTELENAAQQRIAQRNANELLLADAQLSGQLNFEAEGRQAINGLITDFTQSSLGGLIDAIDNGQPIDPRAVDAARIQFATLRREIERSLVNVTDDQREEVVNQFEQIDNIINNVGSVISSEGQAERLSSYVLQLMTAGDITEYSRQQILAATLASLDVASFITSGAGADIYWQTNPQIVQDIVNRFDLTITNESRRQAAAALPAQSDGTTNRNGVISFEDIPEPVRRQIAEIDESSLISSMRVDGLLLGDVNQNNVNSPDMAERLVNRTYELGAYMLSTEGRPLTPELVQQLGLGPSLADNLNTLESLGLDDEGEALARVTIRSGLATQISAQQNYLNRVEQTNQQAGLRWNEQTGEYEITNREFIEAFAQSISMSPDMMMENGVVRLRANNLRDEGWRRQLRMRVGNLDEAFAYRESLGLLQGAFDSLQTEVPEDQGLAPVAEGFIFTSQTRAQLPPTEGMLNISMDFNASPEGNARGTEVIIPDNASPEVRAAAEEFNRLVADFAARNGIEGYPVRGVRTRSENGRGIRNTVHAEPFFNTDLDMQRAIQENPAEFAAIYAQAFGRLPNARVLAAHGEGNDRGATSEIFGDETSFGALMAQSFTGDVGDIGATTSRPAGGARPAGGTPPQAQTSVEPLPTPDMAPEAQTSVAPMTLPDMTVAETPAETQMAQPEGEQPQTAQAPQRAAQPASEPPPPAQIARSLQEIAQGSQQTFGEDNTVASRAMALVQRAEAGEDIGYEEVYSLLSEALRLPATPEKRRLVNDLYDLAESMRGQ